MIVSDQNIGKNNENIMCSWYLLWQTLEVSGIAKQYKLNENALYIYIKPHKVYPFILAKNEFANCSIFPLAEGRFFFGSLDMK